MFVGIIKSSLIDYPGKIATVLFTPGCNLDCFYCHNRSIIEQTQAEIPMDDIVSFLRKRVGLVDAVVISGGEPTIHPSLEESIRVIKEMGFLIKLDTNGHDVEKVSHLIQENLLDYVSIDYKAPIDDYILYTGKHANPLQVIETIAFVETSGVDYEVRTTVFPQLTIHHLIQMAKELPIVKRYALNPYRKPTLYSWKHKEWVEMTAYSDQDIQRFCEELSVYQPNMVFHL
jgi:pyruvate formate lyase activating enzyme